MQNSPVVFEDLSPVLEFWKWLIPAAAAAAVVGIRWLWNIGRGHYQRMATVDVIAEDVAAIKTSLAELVSRARYSQARIEVRDETDITPHFRADDHGRCVWVNQAYADFVGRAREELLGEGWRKILAPVDRDRALEEWAEAVDGVTEQTIDSGQEFRSRFVIVTDAGDYIPCQAIAFPIYHSGNKIEWIGSLKRYD